MPLRRSIAAGETDLDRWGAPQMTARNVQMRAWAAANPSCAAVIDFDALAAREGAPSPIPNDGHFGVRSMAISELIGTSCTPWSLTVRLRLQCGVKYAKAKEQQPIEVLRQPATGFWSPDGWALKSLKLHENGCTNHMNTAIMQVRFFLPAVSVTCAHVGFMASSNDAWLCPGAAFVQSHMRVIMILARLAFVSSVKASCESEVPSGREAEGPAHGCSGTRVVSAASEFIISAMPVAYG